MSKAMHAGHSASVTNRHARSRARITVSLLALVFASAILSSCSGMWTALNNPVDPVACEVDTFDYWRLFYYESSSATDITTTTSNGTYDPVLENLRYSSGYQVLYVGFNDGTYSVGDLTAPFIMITTKYIANAIDIDGVSFIDFPILNGMTIVDSLGIEHHPWVYSTGNRVYAASDGKIYTYEVSTFWADPAVDTNLTYFVSIDATNVFAYDGTPLDRSYYFQVSNAGSGNAGSGDVSIGLLDGISAALSCDFSASDPYWEWSRGNGSGSINIATGRYSLFARSTTDSYGNNTPGLFCKRYPHEIPGGTFAVRASNSFSSQETGAESGLYLTDSRGNPVAAIKIDAYGWLQCFGPGSSDGMLRSIHEQSIDEFDYASSVLGIRHDGGTLYFYVNGECVASTERNGKKITNAGLFVAERDSGYESNASFDDFVIAY